MVCFRSSSEKYSPVEWTNYFDKEDDVSIPGSDDVSVNECFQFWRTL